jgi:FkbM family methyltransferase
MINYFNVLIAIKVLCKNYIRIILNKIIRIPIKKVEMNNGIKFFVNKNIGKADLSMFSEIWYREFYNPPFFSIKNKDIIIDIGANNGYFSIYASSLAKNGMIYSFEPAPDLYEIIKKNIDINKISNIKIFNSGVAGNDTKLNFYLSKGHNGCHSLYRRSPDDEEIRIDAVNLENFCFDKKIEKINLLKLDCEGAEYEIILNFSINFLEKIEKITMEYHDDINEHKHDEIVNFLENNNFLVCVKSGYLYGINLKNLKN